MLTTTFRNFPSLLRTSGLTRLCIASQHTYNGYTCSKELQCPSNQLTNRSTLLRPHIVRSTVRLYSKKAGKQSEDDQNGDDSNNPVGLQYKLTDMDPVCWGSVTKMIKKSIESYFFRNWFEPSWNEEEFLKGAGHAISVVSDAISRGDFAAIDGLVAEETIKEVRENYERMTEDERSFIKVNPEDFVFSIVFQFGFKEIEQKNRYVSVYVVAHGYDGAAERMRSIDSTSLRDRALVAEEAKRTQAAKYYVLNYCFTKRIYLQTGKDREGDDERDPAEDQWTINELNHFKLDEYKKFYMWRR